MKQDQLHNDITGFVHTKENTSVKLNGELVDKQLQYWKEKLQGVTPLLLPTDFPRQAVQTTNGAVINFSINQDLVEQLQQLSNQQGVTLFMTTLAAFKVLLYRYTEQQDICVGTATANRTSSYEVENLIDFFANTLALRDEVNGENSFTEFLHQVKETTIKAYENQEVAFEKVVEAVVKESDLSRNPLFEVIFVWQNLHTIPTFNLKDVEVSTEKYDSRRCKFDLTFIIKAIASGLEISVEYCTDLFSEPTIKRMIAHYKQLLGSIVKQPHQKIGLLSMLTVAEKHQLLVEFNDTAAAYPKDKTIVDLFEEQAARTPEATAIIFKDEQLTYKELNERCNQLAHYLKSKDVKEETLVPIFIERSIEMIVGILGILKAGAAYVPIDTEYPKERIQYMLGDLKARIMVSNEYGKSKLQGIVEDIFIIEPGNRLFNLNNQPLYNPQTRPKANHLAYMIYTSGSTGKPKGAAVTHSGVTNLLLWYIKEFSITHKDKNLIISSPAFDLTQKNIFSPLLVGGTIVLPDLHYYDSSLIIKCIREKSVTIINCAPSAFYPLVVDNINLSGLNSLRLVVLGGEPIHLKQLENWILQEDYECEIVNSYGPTECTDIATFFRMKTPKEFINKVIPIGKPNNNVQLLVLNKFEQLQPIGVFGEICISGDSLGAGYVNDKVLTDEKFIEISISKDAKTRIYKTGDVGRWREEGNIEYLGRKDNQVKINGNRIELGEIESALNQHSAIQQAVVLTREDSPGSQRLVAYIVAHHKHIPTSELHQFLIKKLPEYMVPSVFVFLKSMPVTPHGKIDRSSLPVPDQERIEMRGTSVPKNAIELKLKNIWEECLKVSSIGVDENFFELGGNSIQAAQLFSSIRKNMGKQLPLSILFKAPTIEELAIYVSEESPEIFGSSIVPIQPKGFKQPLFLMHAGAGTVLLYKSLTLYLGSDQPVYGIQAKGLNGYECPHTRIEDMATHYINEIRTVQSEGPYLLGGYCLGVILAFEMAQQLTRQNQKVALIANFNGVSPIYIHPADLPNVIEDENDLKTNTDILSEGTSDHFKKFVSLTTKNKIVFLLRKIISYKRWRKIRGVFYKFYIFRNKPLPAVLLKSYFLATNDAIAAKYKPKPYPGRMIIFRSPEIYLDPYLGWDGLVTGGIETCDIPGKHINRREIINEPFVQYTAKKLKYYLENIASSHITKFFD